MIAGPDEPPAPDALDDARAGQRAVRGSVLRSGGYAAGILMSLISAPLIIRHLGVDDFGIYVTITALTTIVAGVSDLGLTSLAVREWATATSDERRELLSDLLGARLAFTAIGVLFAFGFALAAGYDGRELAATAVACVALVIMGLQSAMTVPLAGRLKQGWIAGADLVRQAVQILIVVALVLAGAGLVPLLAATVAGAVAALVVTAWPATDALTLPAFRPRRWFALLHGAIPFVAASALSVIYLRATVILTSLIATESENGAFAIAFRVLEVLINVPALLIGALFPLLARASGDGERLRSYLAPMWSASVAAGAVAAVGIASGAPIAVLALEGSQLPDAVDALRILGAALGFSFVGAFAQYSLLALRAHREILIVNGLALTLNVVLTLILAARAGAPGAAAALALAEATGAVLSVLFLRRAAPEAVTLGVPLRAVPALAAGAAVAVVLTPVGIVVAAVCAGLTCVAAVVALGLIPPAAWAALPGRRRAVETA